MAVAISIRCTVAIGRWRWNIDDPIAIHRRICRCCAYCCPQRPVLASDSRHESSVTIRVDELDWLAAAKGCGHFWRSHLAKKKQELAVAEWLAGQRVLGSGFDDVRDVPIGETHGVCLVGDHCRKERIDSGHTL